MYSAESQLKSALSTLQTQSETIKSSMDTFTETSPVTSDMVDRLVEEMTSNGLDTMKDDIDEGKWGDSLFIGNTQNIAPVGRAQENLRQLAADVETQEQREAVGDIARELQDEQRNYQYATISYENGRDKSEEFTRELEYRQDALLDRLITVFEIE